MQCAIRGHRLILVSDPVIDARLQRQLEDLGAVVDIVREYAPGGGYATEPSDEARWNGRT